MTSREERLAIARATYLDYINTAPISKNHSCKKKYQSRNTVSDLQIVADIQGVTKHAVKQALKTREQYPNNILVKQFDHLQWAKQQVLKKA